MLDTLPSLATRRDTVAEDCEETDNNDGGNHGIGIAEFVPFENVRKSFKIGVEFEYVTKRW